MNEIEVVKGRSLRAGDSTKGIVRERAFEGDRVLFARSQIAGGVESGWHHHGQREVYGFILAGRLRFDFGVEGRISVEAGAGDFFHIPIGLVHRDVNPDPKVAAIVVNIFLGQGPPVVNV